MASNAKVNIPSEGLYVTIFGKGLALTVITEKVVEVRHGKKVVDTITEQLDHPFAQLNHPKTGTRSLRGIAGTIIDKNGDADPATAGETALYIDGEKVPFTLVPGLTKKEGATTSKGAPAKRNPKLDTGENGVLVAWKGETYKLSFGVSQTDPNCLYIWGSLRVASATAVRATPTEDDLVSLGDLAAF